MILPKSLNSKALKVTKRLLSEFPGLELNIEQQDGGHVEISLEAPTNSRAKVLVVLTSNKGDIWVRFAPPRACYPVDDEKELVRVVKDLLADQALFVVITHGNEWAGTTFIRPDTRPSVEPGQHAEVYSWSGLLDFAVDC